jgi:diguanylate cyclase (GGDEF)-like protein/PAS domain S-box-containing protein
MRSTLAATVQLTLSHPARVLSVTGDVETLLGFSAKQFLSNEIDFFSLIHPHDQDVLDRILSTETDESEASVNLRLRMSDGHIRCIFATYKPSISSAGTSILELHLTDAKSLWSKVDSSSLLTNFDAMMVNTDDFIYFKDRFHLFTGASQSLVELTEPATHWTDLLGKTDYDVFPEEYADEYYRLEKQVFAGASVAHDIQEMMTTDGRKGWVDNRKYPIVDESGRIIGLFGIARDITLQKLAEESLIINEKRFRAIFEQIPSISVQGYNKNREVIFWNKASEELYGYSAEQAHGRLLEDLIIPAAMREQVIRLIADWVEGGAAIPASELTLQHANGSPVEVYSSHVMLPGPDGEPEMYCIDISQAERLASEKALRASEAFLRTVIDEIPNPIVIKDHNAKFLLCNKAVARLYNTEPQLMIGKDDGDFGVPRDMADFFRENVLAIMEKGQTEVVIEDSVDAVTGEVRHYKSIKKPFKSEYGQNLILIIAQDITDIIQAQEQVVESEKRLQQVMEITREGVWDWDILSGKVIHNSQWYRTLLYSPEELPDTVQTFVELIHPEDREAVWERLNKLLEGTSKSYHSEHRLIRNDGKIIWVHDRGGVVARDADGNALRVIGSFSDITYHKDHQARLEKMAHYDALTGLPNRALLADRLQQSMAAALRRESNLAIIYVDLDAFKPVNDAYGHETGDHLLVVLADRMKHELREGDTLARMGGDEFVVVMNDLPDIEACAPLITRLLDAAAEMVIHDGHVLKVSASLGVTFFPQTEEIDADQLLRQADQAMYQAKLAGKNRYHIFDMAQDLAVRGHHESLDRIRQGLINQEFVLYYQPKVNMRTGEVTGAEALIRWQHPDKGLLLPALFLPVVEDHQLAIDIDKWVMETALIQMSQWHSLGKEIPISVNVSAKQLQQSDFVQFLQTIFHKYPEISPKQLQLEVLETSALEDIDQVSRLVSECSEMGVLFALDDFGTGYSSLIYLKQLAVGVLKIDQTFVHDMLDDPEDLMILEGVIGLANAFRREVIAEGVETIEHGEMLLQIGCELAQGYAIALPMPGESIPGWVDHWKVPKSWVNRLKVKHEDLPLLYAIVEHRGWLSSLKNYFEGQNIAPRQIDPAQCRFNSTLGHLQQSKRLSLKRYQRINRIHFKLHELAAELTQEYQINGSGKVLGRMDEMLTMSDQLIRQFRELIK